MLTEAVNEDSDGNVNDAFEIYTSAVELFLKIVIDFFWYLFFQACLMSKRN